MRGRGKASHVRRRSASAGSRGNARASQQPRARHARQAGDRGTDVVRGGGTDRQAQARRCKGGARDVGGDATRGEKSATFLWLVGLWPLSDRHQDLGRPKFCKKAPPETT